TEAGADGSTRIEGVRGTVLEATDLPRGEASSRTAVGEFEFRAAGTVVASGGIGGNLDLVRKRWPTGRWGPAPEDMATGLPARVDVRLIGISVSARAILVNSDRSR